MYMNVVPIGLAHTPFAELSEVPKDTSLAAGVHGTVEVFTEYRAGLQDLTGFSHVVLLSYLHKSRGYDLLVTPPMDSRRHGLFATRSPRRPNPIGLSVVVLRRIEDGVLYVEQLDLLDGTPVIDIKPYYREVDPETPVRTGWIAEVQ
jgi:tRNA-Thr(GGU) m(6)t(6)A37 methyltransferase TsaA